MIVIKVHELDMGDSIVIKIDEIKAEMVNYIKRNMTITLSLILNQVDKYFHNYTISISIVNLHGTFVQFRKY